MKRKIKEFKDNNFTDKNGNKWYGITFESGETAMWGTKKTLSEGMEIDCDLIDATNKQGDIYKKVALTQGQRNFQKKQDEPFEHKAAGFSASYTKDLIVADKITVKEFRDYFTLIYDLIVSKKVQ